ncbi:probable prefoldin subunit 2 [Teleopsis dalmanni]|uniref:probable prefoldin subunit 2 n=1 Tax=Teleopsis dalmanni TaxID=139649 RepID=UPI0018CF0DB5|nr:probable prefoldin subunit 2 [Teleopsis dalmanni]
MATEQLTNLEKRQKVFLEYEKLVIEQKLIFEKLTDLEADLADHKNVIEKLSTMDPERKCSRLINCVLTERKVKDVLPQLIAHVEFLEGTIPTMNCDLKQKSEAISKYKQEHNLGTLPSSFQMPLV